jgi:hypothetical protein
MIPITENMALSCENYDYVNSTVDLAFHNDNKANGRNIPFYKRFTKRRRRRSK